MVSSQESTWGKSVNVTPFRGRDRTFVRIVTVQVTVTRFPCQILQK